MKSIKVCARAKQEIDDIAEWNNQEIYKLLIEMYPQFQKIKGLCLSDMFLAGFLYKPLSFEQVFVQSDDEYKVLKKLKKTKYIDQSLLERVKTGRDLVAMLLSGEAAIRGEYICDVLKDRVDVQVSKGSALEFYMMVPEEYEGFCVSEGTVFEICSFENNNKTNRRKDAYVLQAAMKVASDVRIHPESQSVFRVQYSESDGSQYFKAGSVFTKEDHIFVMNIQGVQAYGYYVEGIVDGK